MIVSNVYVAVRNDKINEQARPVSY